ncbi:DUF4389 domain-containing protein [Aldersonia sp. NBC_00410]|uniref:DUF4389 domain-containing protein n=1 Tax=Aldersonia sp. NBC_00410 TaxID=2975954 RepID=UPI0022574C6D|nr:DUF4389 domain-containing protein [Aldersonia sp. NBC_00410]MCX5046648.1 DUF4389 domain-containing protein [Aldersonia sp. NBC_00410]
MNYRLTSSVPDPSHHHPHDPPTDRAEGGHAGSSARLPLLGIDSGQRQRRWTILLRLILVLPHLLVLTVVGIAAIVVRLLGWLGTLLIGRLPGWCRRFLAWYLSYAIRVSGYAYLLVDRYPPIRPSSENYPVRIVLPEPTRLNRWAVFFRTLLSFPVLVLSALFVVGWAVAGLFIWLIVLVLGRMPSPIAQASEAILRLNLRTQAYYDLLTPEYPKRIFGDPLPPSKHAAPTGDDTDLPPEFRIHVSTGGRALMAAMLAFGIGAYCAQLASSLAIADMNRAERESVVATAEQDAVIAAVSNYYRAVAANDGAQACAILSPALAQSLATQARTDSCPGAIYLSHRRESQSRLDRIANIKFDARDADIDGNDASLGIYEARNGSAELAQKVLLKMQENGQWLIVGLG